MSEFILKEKLILITGASSGIGRACAIEFAKHDTNIALVARNTKKSISSHPENTFQVIHS